jgi:hypothetical protein
MQETAMRCIPAASGKWFSFEASQGGARRDESSAGRTVSDSQPQLSHAAPHAMSHSLYPRASPIIRRAIRRRVPRGGGRCRSRCATAIV